MTRKDDEFEDDAPRKPRRREKDDDEFDDAPSKARRRDDEDEDDDRPSKRVRRRSDDDEDEDDFSSRRPRAKSKVPMILGIVAAALLLVCGGSIFGIYTFLMKTADKVKAKVAEAKARQDSVLNDRIETQINMKEIGLAANEFIDRKGGFPTNSYDRDGKPLLSWRVHLLPYLNEVTLYQQFKLNEPWDSPSNKRLLRRMPRIYASPADNLAPASSDTTTYIRAFSSTGTIMDPKFGRKVPLGLVGPGRAEVEDGLANTIFLFESGEDVAWTKPDDITWSGGDPLPAFGGSQKTSTRFWVLFADGSVRAVLKSMPPHHLKAATTIAGIEQVFLP